MAINIITTLMPKKDFGDILRKMKEPRKQPAVRKDEIKAGCKSRIIESHADDVPSKSWGQWYLFLHQCQRDT